MDINKALDHFMAIHNFNQQDISRECSLSKSGISLIRNGLRQPNLVTMVILAELFQVKLSEFVSAGE